MKAHVTYLCKTGITRKYASEIDAFLWANKVESTMQNIHDADPLDAGETDLILLGAWCHGLFILLQHPDKPWVEFARKLPDLSGKKVALFTTYKLADNQPVGIFKSKNGSLSECDKERLLIWVKS